MGHTDSILDNLREIHPLREFPKIIEAACFNTVRVALLRLGSPLRIELKRPRLVMLLESNHWVAVSLWDEALPLLLWKDFDPVTRDNLHESVRCTLALFDHCAGLVMGTALDALHHELRVRLNPTGR
ncbi:MAG: hypothetical protein HY273_01595 [Gammaproteobacteria bacterium]|nr:hypothetical protein [Gammaproteobacteria bacterium]